MAATTGLSSQPTAQKLIDNLSATDNSFLARSIRDLDPVKTSAFNWQSYHFQAGLWDVAAKATIVVYIALAAGVFFYTGMFFPVYVPYAGMGAIIGAGLVANFFEKMSEFSNASLLLSQKYQALQNNFELQNQKTTLQLQNDLTARGIVWHQIPGMGESTALPKLNPLLAQVMFLDDKMKEDMDLKQKFTERAAELARANSLENHQKICALRKHALMMEDRALQTKVHAAFVNAVLRKSNYNGTLDDIAILTDVRYDERILGDAFNDPAGVNTFISFKNRNIASISHADVKRMSVAELGQRLVAAMA